MEPFESHLKEGLKILLQAPTDMDKATWSPATYYAHCELPELNGTRTRAYVGSACHAHLSLKSGYSTEQDTDWETPVILMSNCQYAPVYEEQSLVYLNWILSPTESPWKRLISEGFHTVDGPDGRIRGFYFDQYRLKQFPFWMFKNFCVAGRLVYEYPLHVTIFKRLVDLGVSKHDAFLLCSFSSVNNSGKLTFHTLRAGGHHWPIRPYGKDGGYFDYNRWINCDPRPHYKNTNGCWTSGEDQEGSILTKNLYEMLCLSVPVNNVDPWSESKIPKIEDLYVGLNNWKEKACPHLKY